MGAGHAVILQPYEKMAVNYNLFGVPRPYYGCEILLFDTGSIYK